MRNRNILSSASKKVAATLMCVAAATTASTGVANAQVEVTSDSLNTASTVLSSDTAEEGSLAELNLLLAQIPSQYQDLAIQGSIAAIADPSLVNELITVVQRIIAGQYQIEELPRVIQAATSPSLPCNSMSRSGGQGGYYYNYNLGRSGPTGFNLDLQTYRIEDRITVLYEGHEIYDSGWVGTRGWRTQWISVPPGISQRVMVRVEAPQSGTDWNIRVNCP